MIYFIIGIFLLLLFFGIRKINSKNFVTENIASRFYAIKERFGDDDEISINKYLEMAGVFSQIVYISRGKLDVETIKQIADEAVKSKYANDIEFDEFTILCRFCISMTRLVFEIEGSSFSQANIHAIKKSDSIKSDIKRIIEKGVSEKYYNATTLDLITHPSSLSGNYNL